MSVQKLVCRRKSMSNIRLYLPVAALIGASLLGSRTAGTSGGYLETNLSANARTETDSIPSPLDPLGADGTPTGAVFNLDLAGQGFKISGVDKNNNAATAAAIFLFATEDGTIVGWNPGINPAGFDPNKAGTYSIIAVDNSTKPTAADGAVYKGLAMAKDAVSGNTFLYATNFRAGTVQVYDTAFKLVTPSANAFTDPKLPSGYAPFNIVPAGGVLYVTYAVQDAAKHDDVAGRARGVVDTFDLSGPGRA